MENLSSCAATCLSSAIANSTCAPSDLTCICTNVALNNQATVCIQGSCTMVEILSTMNITNTLCGVEPAFDDSWHTQDIVLLSLMLIVVVMRFLARATVDMPFWWDDWMNFIAVVSNFAAALPRIPVDFIDDLTIRQGFCIGLNVTSFQGLKPNGYGKDVWAVHPENLTKFLKSYYVATLMYVGARCFTRISIILFYLRIFTIKEARRKIIYTLIAESIASLSYFLTMVFQCTPISYSWKKWDLQHTGHCIDLYHFMIVGWAILIASDFWVMWLPLSVIAKLQLSLRKKLLVSVMFATGLVVTAVGIAKLPKVYPAIHTMNPTYDLVGMNKFCSIEVDLGVICSCMPSLPVLFRPLFDRLTGRPTTSTDRGPSPRGPWMPRAVTDMKNSGARSTAREIRDILENRDAPSPRNLVPTHAAELPAYNGQPSPRKEQIQAITTINQTYWRNDSNETMVQHGSDVELGTVEHRYTGSQAWAYGPGAGSYGDPRQLHQR